MLELDYHFLKDCFFRRHHQALEVVQSQLGQRSGDIMHDCIRATQAHSPDGLQPTQGVGRIFCTLVRTGQAINTHIMFEEMFGGCSCTGVHVSQG